MKQEPAAATPTLPAVEATAPTRGLLCLGALHEGPDTIVLLGPHPSGFWTRLLAAPEAGQENPVDTWSRRVIGDWAREIGATPLFPFGEPVQPFLRWAQASGRCHVSPVGMLVHDRLGLMVSFRGALRIRGWLDLPTVPPRPCKTCAAPCLTACPVGALAGDGYDLPACHDWLDDPRNTCMARGCEVRRACPVSPARPDAQSAHHMSYFHRVER